LLANYISCVILNGMQHPDVSTVYC